LGQLPRLFRPIGDGPQGIEIEESQNRTAAGFDSDPPQRASYVVISPEMPKCKQGRTETIDSIEAEVFEKRLEHLR
jgi:hypothetical protein